VELTIEKLIYGGDGLARLPAGDDGRRKAAFVQYTLPGETVEAGIVEEKPGFVRAKVERMLAPSPDRIAPGCPYFGSCGGCHYQHAKYEHQLELKKSILRETVERIAKTELPAISVHASPPWHYRNRTRFHIQRTPEFAIGYYRLGSHQLLPVRECPISAEIINRSLAALWNIGDDLPRELSEVEFFCSNNQQQLMIELWVSSPPSEVQKNFRPVSDRLRTAVPELIITAILRKPARGKSFAESVAAPELDAASNADAPLAAFGQQALAYRAAGFEYRVSPGSFFQTNLFLADELTRIVTGERAGKLALDLYAGVGLFSLALASSFEHVIAVETAPTSFADLRHNAPHNVRAISATTEEFLATKQNWSPDLVLTDPPRAGLGSTVASALARLNAPEIGYLSCDPSTQARDIVPLLKAGYRISEVHLIDLFPQTYHIESFIRLAR